MYRDDQGHALAIDAKRDRVYFHQQQFYPMFDKIWAKIPFELPRRCIKLFSFTCNTILDPFLGSGSTLLACLQTGRAGVGVDIDKKYCELAKRRLLTEGQINQIRLTVVAEGK